MKNAVKSEGHIPNHAGSACAAEEVATTKEGIKSCIASSSYNSQMQHHPTSDYYWYDSGREDLIAP